ncbi:MAG: hypothetical protein HY909_19735 [Deltaproteobacteria bacterium]|nr:hypothetical protein [Deltaproteobacteria bacterium]
MWTTTERRARRSEDLYEALTFLLASQRERAGLDQLVLATPDGCLVACDGDPQVAEEYAAYAPVIARDGGVGMDPWTLAGVAVHEFRAGDLDLLLVLRGVAPTERLAAAVMASIQGAARILAR